MTGSSYLSPCSISWGWGDWLCSVDHIIDLKEEVVVVEEVEEVWRDGLLVPKEMYR